jgi:hypothetical protein
LHLPKIQYYLQDEMQRTRSRLQISHDMILAELAKIAFSNMGNYYDEYAVLKPMNQLTNDEKAAISQYQIMDALDDRGQRIGELSKIKLHNKMAALDKIARHLGFYDVAGKKVAVGLERKESPEPDIEVPEISNEVNIEVNSSLLEEGCVGLSSGGEVLSSIDPSLHSRMVGTGTPVGRESHSAGALEQIENLENILTISPLRQCLNDRIIEGLNEECLFIGEFALAIAADTGPSTGSGQAPAGKAHAV